MDVAVLPDSRIVAVGSAGWYDFNGGIGGTNLLMARFNENGALDPTFHNAAFGGGPDQSASTVALMPNGTLVYAGQGNTWDDGFYGPQRFLVGRVGGQLVATIQGGPAGPISSSSAAFEFGLSESGSTAECKLDGPGATTGSFTPCTSPKTYSGLADGAYTFSVRAVDASGTRRGYVETQSFSVDTRVPVARITSGPSGPTHDTRAWFEFTAIAGSTFECRFDGPGASSGSWASCSPPKIYERLADGNYTFSVRATVAGRTGPATTQAFSVDTVPPAVTITGGPSGSPTSPQFSFTSSGGPIASTECAIIGGHWYYGQSVPCASPHTLAPPHTLGPLAGGSYEFIVRVMDEATNWGQARRSFTVDAPPDTAITGGLPGGSPTRQTAVSWEFRSTAASSTFECRLDTPAGAGSYAACGSPQAYSALADGDYTFSVRAVGPAGTDATPATRSWRVDNQPPNTTITGASTGTTSTFSFTASEDVLGFSCKLDTPAGAGEFVPCTSPKTYSTPANGPYTFTVNAMDRVYFMDPTPAAHAFMVSPGPSPTPTATPSPSPSPTPSPSPSPSPTPSASPTPSPSPSPTPAACALTNGNDVRIPDLQTVESAIAVTGCPGNAAAAATVEVHLMHTYIGDLVVSLIAPDGSAYVLHNRAGGSADDINQTYTVNLSSEPANGTWKLRVQDAAAGDSGRIDAWTVNLGTGPSPSPSPSPTPASCAGTNGNDVPVPDLATAESSITIAGCARSASASATVEVHVLHTYIGDLVVSLIAPDGSAYVLHNRAGGSADNIHQTYTVNLSSEASNGSWKLRVQDAAAADVGRIDSWTLNL
jgi:subtilisin-like proprotein convertase family protein